MRQIIFAALKANQRHIDLCLDMYHKTKNEDDRVHWFKQLNLTVDLSERIKNRFKSTILKNVIFVDFKVKQKNKVA